MLLLRLIIIFISFPCLFLETSIACSKQIELVANTNLGEKTTIDEDTLLVETSLDEKEKQEGNEKMNTLVFHIKNMYKKLISILAEKDDRWYTAGIHLKLIDKIINDPEYNEFNLLVRTGTEFIKKFYTTKAFVFQKQGKYEESNEAIYEVMLEMFSPYLENDESEEKDLNIFLSNKIAIKNLNKEEKRLLEFLMYLYVMNLFKRTEINGFNETETNFSIKMKEKYLTNYNDIHKNFKKNVTEAIEILKNKHTRKILSEAEYFYKNNDYLAALIRYDEVIKNSEGMPEECSEALLKTLIIYRDLKVYSEVKYLYKILKKYFSNTKWFLYATRIVSKIK